MIWFDDFDGRHDEFDARGDKIAHGLDHIVLAVDAEGDEEETGLVVVGFVLVNNRDAPFVLVEEATHAVGDHGAGGASAENEKGFHILLLCRCR